MACPWQLMWRVICPAVDPPAWFRHFDYLDRGQGPKSFAQVGHELMGHCPALTNEWRTRSPGFAGCSQKLNSCEVLRRPFGCWERGHAALSTCCLRAVDVVGLNTRRCQEVYDVEMLVGHSKLCRARGACPLFVCCCSFPHSLTLPAQGKSEHAGS